MSKKPNLKDLEQQVVELTEALQRERADSMNVRRRTDEERAQLGDFYKAMILRELLPALDNLDRANKNNPVPENLSGEGDVKIEWIRGIRKIEKQFEDCFAKLGVQRIKTVGEPFDPKLHEAISVEDPSAGSGQAHSLVEVVCEELQPGYRIGDEIIRHALVRVKMQSSSKLESEGEEKK